MNNLEQRKAALLKELAEIEKTQATTVKRRPVVVQEAAQRLTLHLVSDKNVQTIGVVEKNIESYNKNPQSYDRLITEDSLIVYTYHKPTAEELSLSSYEGFKVQWIEQGQATPQRFSKKER